MCWRSGLLSMSKAIAMDSVTPLNDCLSFWVWITACSHACVCVCVGPVIKWHLVHGVKPKFTRGQLGPAPAHVWPRVQRNIGSTRKKRKKENLGFFSGTSGNQSMFRLYFGRLYFLNLRIILADVTAKDPFRAAALKWECVIVIERPISFERALQQIGCTKANRLFFVGSIPGITLQQWTTHG